MPTAITLPAAAPAELAAQLPAGNLAILGGPGTGKTTLLEELAYALAAPRGGRALLLTSTRQAAQAATERLLARVERAAGSALGCVTWHAFAWRLVTSHADRLAYRGQPRLLSGPEQWALVRSLLLEARPVDWGERASLVTTRAFADELAEFVLACERRLISPAELARRAAAEGRPAWELAARFLEAYTDHLALADSVDEAGVLVQAGDLLEDHPAVLAATAAGVGTVLVDEAQDLDPAQLRLLRLLSGGGARLILAGDPAGGPDWPRDGGGTALQRHARALGCQEVHLARSWRLGEPAATVVRRLQAGSPVPVRGEGTTQVEVERHAGPVEEAEAIARLLRAAHQRGVPYGRMAVLLPAPRRLMAPIRRALDRYQVPYGLAAGERQLLTEPLVASVLDLFRVAADRERAAELLPTLLTSPLGRLDPHELRALRRHAVLTDRSLADLVLDPEALRDPAPGMPGGVGEATAERVSAFRALLDEARGWVDELEADHCFWELWRRAAAFADLVARAEGDPADARVRRQLDALTAFSRALSLFVDGRPGATMRSYLDVVERAGPSGDPWLPPAAMPAGAVALLPPHAARGREFTFVVVAGCLEGTLPRTAWPQGLFEAWRLDGDLDPVARADALLNAERQRFTLAASRARERVVFTYSKADGRGEPSRFLLEAGLALPSEPHPGDPEPAGAFEAVGALRRVLADRARPAAERLAAATTLARMPEVDPASWWWQRDWTHDPEPIAPDGSLRTSYTRIGTYEDCHLRYFYSSVAGLDDRTSYAMQFGKLMHTIFELAAKGEIAHEPAALKAAYRERFDPTWFPSRAVAYQYWADGMRMLELWYQGEAASARNALAFEVSFEIPVGRHQVRGRIDRVDRVGDGIALLDYKTSRLLASEAEAASSLQLAIYYLAALRDPELAKLGPPVELQLAYPARASQGRFHRVIQRVREGDAERAERRLLALLDGAAAEAFDPNPHADCRFCLFKIICPMWPQGEDFLAPPRREAAAPGGAVEVAP